MAVKNKKLAQKVKPVNKKEKKPQPPPQESEEDDDDLEEQDDEELSVEADSDLGGEEEQSDAEEEADSEEKEETDVEVDPPAVAKKKPTVEKTELDDEESMKATVFVGHIKFDISKKELEEFFSGVGEIKNIRIIAKRGFAFIQFANEKVAKEALKLDNKPLDGKEIHLEMAKSKRSVPDKKRKAPKHDDQPVSKKANTSNQANKSDSPQKGKPKTPQSVNPNKKRNKPKPGQFVKAK
ncbi:uncharacterized protein LOC131684948 [Topomyia yanbarensis]|uniref:uncharacterized protein LOC131684948 n=1 Tax=Topomyia yanbarensis TaxID=2498891 RepID=UPI00273BF825|nr:uncharacterized protein LOC131684948 [Topomyia yanbarensis]XP_058824222.1 uncharacterized protein LOC131684948 [Topomyia yanbarensis]